MRRHAGTYSKGNRCAGPLARLTRSGGAACLLVGVLDRAVDELERAGAPLGLDPPAIAGEPAREIGLAAVLALRQSGGIELLGHADPFSERTRRFG